MHGTTCFGCGGSGVKYTKRGDAARVYLLSLRSKRADQFVVGELFHVDAGPFNSGGWCEIESISLVTGAEAYARGNRYTNGVENKISDSLNFKFKPGKINMSGHDGILPDRILRRACSADEKARTLALAVEYQNTLTKMGKVRKSKGGK
jgi:hypothetical protein